MQESTHFGQVGTLHPIASGTDGFDDIRYGMPVAACGFGSKSTKVKQCYQLRNLEKIMELEVSRTAGPSHMQQLFVLNTVLRNLVPWQPRSATTLGEA